MELLSSLHWVASEEPQAARDPQVATAQLHAWNDRKRNTFRPEHALKAWQRLQREDWLGAPGT